MHAKRNRRRYNHVVKARDCMESTTVSRILQNKSHGISLSNCTSQAMQKLTKTNNALTAAREKFAATLQDAVIQKPVPQPCL